VDTVLKPEVLLSIAAVVLALAAAWRIIRGSGSVDSENTRLLFSLASLAASKTPSRLDDEAVTLLKRLCEAPTEPAAGPPAAPAGSGTLAGAKAFSGPSGGPRPV